MIVSSQDIANLRAALREHALNTRWEALLYRATKKHGIDAVDIAAAETVRDLSSEEFDAFCQRLDGKAPESILSYLRGNLHLLIPCGFDEIRINAAALGPFIAALSKELRQRFSDVPQHAVSAAMRGSPLEFATAFGARDVGSGAWYSGWNSTSIRKR